MNLQMIDKFKILSMHEFHFEYTLEVDYIKFHLHINYLFKRKLLIQFLLHYSLFRYKTTYATSCICKWVGTSINLFVLSKEKDYLKVSLSLK